MAATTNPSPPAAAHQLNARLRELGFTPDEARADAGERQVLVRGELVRETVVEPHRVFPLLAMFPPKDRLVMIHRALGVERQPPTRARR